MLLRLWFLLGVCLLLDGEAGRAAEGRRLKILTSIPPLYSWAANVAGIHADVENLLPADVGPHDYQLRPLDLAKIKAADVIFLNGLGLESWFTKTIAANDPKATKKVVEAAAGLPDQILIHELPALTLTGSENSAPSHHGLANPHLWLDPVLAKHAVTNLLRALQSADPVNAAGYATNAATYLARLDHLDADLRTGLDSVVRREVVTFHDAFAYFCRRYGLNLVGVVEEVPGSSPSARYLAELSKAIRDRRVTAIFTEPQFDPRLARQLARDLGVQLTQLDTLETGPLTATAYETGTRSNLDRLRKTLR